MGFSRQEYWSGLPCPPPGDLPHPGMESRCPELQADLLPSDTPGKPQKPVVNKNKMAKVHCVIHRDEKAGGKQVIMPSPLQREHP